jgi:hypothetical protein
MPGSPDNPLLTSGQIKEQQQCSGEGMNNICQQLYETKKAGGSLGSLTDNQLKALCGI